MKDSTISMLAMMNSVQVFAAFLPGFADARAKMTDANGEIRSDVRRGELVASVLALSFGALASSISEDPRPILFSAAVVGGVLVTYEWLMHDRSNDPSEVAA